MDYDNENKCSFCDGEGGWWFTHQNDPSGGPRFHPCVCSNGTRVGELHCNIRMLENRYQQLYKDYKELQDWVKKTSTCKTCKGDQKRTLGGIPCKECGLIGLQPWGG